VSDPITVIIPVKTLAGAKTRLATRLSPSERIRLARGLLTHVLAVVNGVNVVERCVVVSPDPEVLEIARAAGAEPIVERDYRSGRGQNAALEQARTAIQSDRPRAVLVLASDLPLLNGEDLEGMAALALAERTVVVGPDRRSEGTNALLVRPSDALPFCFGVDSFQRHCQEANRRGFAVSEYRSNGVAFDLDYPEDLDELERTVGVAHLLPSEVGQS